MARGVKLALAASCGLATLLGLSTAAIPQSFEYRYTATQRGGAEPGPGGGEETDQSCATPWGAQVLHGQDVTAFLAASVDFGGECVSQVRACNDGTLQGSYGYASCAVELQDEEPDDFNFASVLDADPETSPYSAFVRITGFTGSLPVLVYGGVEAASSVCTGLTSVTCGPLDANDKSVLPGQYLRLSQETGDFGDARTMTVQVGPVSKTWTAAARDADNCSAPWGGSIAHLAAVLAYDSESVPFGDECISQQRACFDGSLSGAGAFSSCFVEEPDVIQPFPLGSASGLEVGAYGVSNEVRMVGLTAPSQMTLAVTGGASSTANIRLCETASCPSTGWSVWANIGSRTVQPGTWLQLRLTAPGLGLSRQVTASIGGISETFTATTRPGLTCDTPWGTPLEHGQTYSAYLAEFVPFNSNCLSGTRSCNDGVLGGSSGYVHGQCTVDSMPRPQPFSFADKTGPAGSATLVKSAGLRPSTLGVGGIIPITVSGPGEFNRNGNGSCTDGTWLSAVTQSETTMSSGNYLCMRATPGSTPGQVKTFTVTIGDQSATWNLIAQ